MLLHLRGIFVFVSLKSLGSSQFVGKNWVRVAFATLATPNWEPLEGANNFRERVLLTLVVACANDFVQPYQFDSESDPEGEAPKEVQTLRLQQDVSDWLVCLNMLLSFFVCVVTVTAM